MAQFFFKCTFFAVVVFSWVTVTRAEPLYLLTQGRAEFEQTAGVPSKVLHSGVLEQFRDRLEVSWMQPHQILPTDSWKFSDDYLVISPLDEKDWSRLSMRITLPTQPDLVEDSFEVQFEVFVQPAARVAFHGVQRVGEIKRKVFEESIYPVRVDQLGAANHFVLKLTEMPPTDVVYNRSAAQVSPQMRLPADVALDIIRDLILIYRIDGNRIYLHELAKALRKYLAQSDALPRDEMDFIDRLYQQPKFVALGPNLQARHLHELASEFHGAANTTSIVSESNGTTNRHFAASLLNRIRLPDDLEIGQSYDEEFQKALQLRLQVACELSTSSCFREMLSVKEIDARHPIDEFRMAIMLNTYATQLTQISRQRAPEQNTEIFTTKVAENPKLAQLWSAFQCTLEQNDGRLALLEFDARFENPAIWARLVMEKADLTC